DSRTRGGSWPGNQLVAGNIQPYWYPPHHGACPLSAGDVELATAGQGRDEEGSSLSNIGRCVVWIVDLYLYRCPDYFADSPVVLVGYVCPGFVAKVEVEK